MKYKIVTMPIHYDANLGKLIKNDFKDDKVRIIGNGAITLVEAFIICKHYINSGKPYFYYIIDSKKTGNEAVYNLQDKQTYDLLQIIADQQSTINQLQTSKKEEKSSPTYPTL